MAVDGIAKEVAQFFRGGFSQVLPLAAQFLADVNGCVDHAIVRRLRPTDKHKVVSGGDPTVAFRVVETDTEKSHEFRFLFRFALAFVVHRRPPSCIIETNHYTLGGAVGSMTVSRRFRARRAA